MTNHREKIPLIARRLAEKVLTRCDVEKKVNNPMTIFAEEIEAALRKEFQAGIRVGRQTALLKSKKVEKRRPKPSEN